MSTEVENKITAIVKNTVGYSEAVNKGHFMVGANVGIGKTMDYYEPIIKSLEKDKDYWEIAYKKIYADFKTLTGLLNKYNTED